jgi:hypothetical protein
MSKSIFLAATLAAGATAVAVTGYISPATPSDVDVPPIEVNLPSSVVMQKLEYLTAEKYIAQMSGKDERIPSYLAFRTTRMDDRQIKFTVRMGGDLVGEVDATVVERDPQHSVIDIVASLPDSKFKRHPALHPYDIKAMESIADLAVTDYVNSVLKTQRMASSEEMETEIVRRVGFSKDQARSFSQRIETAFAGSYGEDLKNAVERRHEPSSYYSEYYSERPQRYGEPTLRPKGTYPSPIADNNREFEASSAARDAGYAAAAAARAAARTAAEAGRAAAEAAKAAERK